MRAIVTLGDAESVEVDRSSSECRQRQPFFQGVVSGGVTVFVSSLRASRLRSCFQSDLMSSTGPHLIPLSCFGPVCGQLTIAVFPCVFCFVVACCVSIRVLRSLERLVGSR